MWIVQHPISKIYAVFFVWPDWGQRAPDMDEFDCESWEVGQINGGN